MAYALLPLAAVRSVLILTMFALAAAGCSSGQLGERSAGPGVSPGTVTFRLALPSARSFCDLSGGCAGAPQHVSITTTSGDAVPLAVGWCALDCDGDCRPHPCDLLCPIAVGTVVDEVEYTWDGSYFPQSTCGAQATPCTDTRFALPGRYRARACATPGAVTTTDAGLQNCTTTGPPECVETLFDIPGPPLVELALPSI